eukprot:g5460.t1
MKPDYVAGGATPTPTTPANGTAAGPPTFEETVDMWVVRTFPPVQCVQKHHPSTGYRTGVAPLYLARREPRGDLVDASGGGGQPLTPTRQWACGPYELNRAGVWTPPADGDASSSIDSRRGPFRVKAPADQHCLFTSVEDTDLVGGAVPADVFATLPNNPGTTITDRVSDLAYPYGKCSDWAGATSVGGNSVGGDSYELRENRHWGIESPHFAIWYHIAATNTFTKLLGKVEQPSSPAPQQPTRIGRSLRLTVFSRFRVNQENGYAIGSSRDDGITKEIILGVNSWVGGRNRRLAVFFFLTGAVVFIVAIYFHYIYVAYSRRVGDVRFLSFGAVGGGVQGAGGSRTSKGGGLGNKTATGGQVTRGDYRTVNLGGDASPSGGKRTNSALKFRGTTVESGTAALREEPPSKSPAASSGLTGGGGGGG